MSNKPEFHGSDLEKIAAYYHIDQSKIIKFGANVNPLGLSESVKSNLAKHLDVISSYPDRDYTELRKVISEYAGTKPEYVITGNGSTELLSLLITEKKPKKALILGPTYSEYERDLSLVGGTIDFFYLKKENQFKLDTKELEAEITDEIGLLIICNPNNPTSSALTTEEMRSVLSICQETGTFVLVDETYVEFAPDIEKISSVPLVDEFDNFMVIRGVSKFFAAPGLRMGYGITSNQSFLRELSMVQNPWSLNSVAEFAGKLMFKDKDYIDNTWNMIQTERARMVDELKKFTELKVYEPYANFILVEILKEGVTSFDLFEAAIKEYMMIRDCSSFQNLNGEFFRFCIMNPEDNDRLLNCIRKVFS